ncbi:MAG: hypothetical protein AAGF53_13575 [Pseudomonadota bacterium]
MRLGLGVLGDVGTPVQWLLMQSVRFFLTWRDRLRVFNHIF